MNWAKENPFLAAILGGTVIAAAAAGYFTYTAYAKFTEQSDAYASAVSRLHNLQNRTPFPSEENVQAFTALSENYDAKLDELIARLAERQVSADPVTPQQFQDNLRAMVSEINALAAANEVQLPEGFYLGFNQYQGTLPSDAAAPVLSAQLNAIRGLVTNLINLRVESIESINRSAIVEEGGAAPAPRAEGARAGRDGGQNGGRRADAGGQQAPQAPVLIIRPVDISFTADQGKVRQALNGIVTDENNFFVLRSLTLQNSALEGPPRVAVGGGAAPTGGDAFTQLLGNQQDGQGSSAAQLQVIVGRETVTVNARIEMITFNLPQSEAPAADAAATDS